MIQNVRTVAVRDAKAKAMSVPSSTKQYTREHARILREVLIRCNLLERESDLPAPDDVKTGASALSRVYCLHIPDRCIDLIAKFDQPERAEREWKNIEFLRGVNHPKDIILPEPKNEREDGVIIYRAAQGFRSHDHWLELADYIPSQLATAPQNCTRALDLTLEPLNEFYLNKSKRDDRNREGRRLLWADLFSNLRFRLKRIRQTAQDAWPEEINWDGPSFHVKALGSERELPNPLREIEERLNGETDNIMISWVHGDLSFTNVLLAKDSAGSPRAAMIIDLAFFKEEHTTASEYTFMEKEFWLRAYGERDGSSNLEAIQTFVQMRDALDGESIWAPESNLDLATNCVKFVSHLRDKAAHTLSPREELGCLVEYFHCLYFSHIAALSSKFVYEEEDKRKRMLKSQIAILGAALALQRLQDHQKGCYSSGAMRRLASPFRTFEELCSHRETPVPSSAPPGDREITDKARQDTGKHKLPHPNASQTEPLKQFHLHSHPFKALRQLIHGTKAMKPEGGLFGNNILFLGAHPDDIEIGCGGIAAKLAAAGHKIAFAVAAGCDAKRNKEAMQAAAELKLSVADGTVFFGPIPDGKLQDNSDELRKWLKAIATQFVPDTVFFHRPDGHTDHEALCKVATGCFQKEAILHFYIPRPHPEVPFTPIHFEDITDHIATKVKMCGCHASQPPEYVGEDSVKTTAHRFFIANRAWANANKYGYAEAFTVVRTLPAPPPEPPVKVHPREWFVKEAIREPDFLRAVQMVRKIVETNIATNFELSPDLAITLYARSFPGAAGIGRFEYDLLYYYNLKDPSPMFGPIVKADQRAIIARGAAPMHQEPITANPSEGGFVAREGTKYLAWFKLAKDLWSDPKRHKIMSHPFDGLLFINARNQELHEANEMLFNAEFYKALSRVEGTISQVILKRLETHRGRVVGVQDCFRLPPEMMKLSQEFPHLPRLRRERRFLATLQQDLSELPGKIEQVSGSTELAVSMYWWEPQQKRLHWIWSNGPTNGKAVIQVDEPQFTGLLPVRVARDPNNKPLLLHRHRPESGQNWGDSVVRTRLGDDADVALAVPILSEGTGDLLGVIDIQNSGGDFDTDDIQILYEIAITYLCPLMTAIRDIVGIAGTDVLPLHNAEVYQPFAKPKPDAGFNVQDLLKLNYNPMKYLLHWEKIEPLVSPEKENRPLPCPSMIEIWPSMLCNQACPWCRCSGFHGRFGDRVPLMSQTSLLGIAHELATDPDLQRTDVLISGGGEPLLHPHIAKFMAKLQKSAGTIGVFTNGTNPGLSEDAEQGNGIEATPDTFLFWEHFFSSTKGHRFVRVSFNGYDPFHYAASHGGEARTKGHYSEAKKTLMDILALRPRNASIAIGSTVRSWCLDTIEKQVEHAKHTGVDFIQLRPELAESIGDEKAWREIQNLVKEQEVRYRNDPTFGVKYTDTERGYQDHDYEECYAAYLVPTLVPGSQGVINVNPCSYALNRFRGGAPSWGWYKEGTSFREFWSALSQTLGGSAPAARADGSYGVARDEPINPSQGCPQCRYRSLNKRLLAIKSQPTIIPKISELIKLLRGQIEPPYTLIKQVSQALQTPEPLPGAAPELVVFDYDQVKEVFGLSKKLGFRPSL